jgi:predicted RNase H-like HicB family nuclease
MSGGWPQQTLSARDRRRYPVPAVNEPLQLTISYEDGEDGFVIARIVEVPAAMSQGRTREEARDNVLDALRELVLSYLENGENGPLPEGISTEALNITVT